jgi:hypothetical protein
VEERYVRRHPQEENAVAGGQGRTAEEIRAAGDVLMWCALILLMAVCVLVLGGCAPSARPRANADQADKPRWDELRQQMGGL